MVVGSGCACAVFRGADIFAPGIMGATLTMNKNDKVLVYADLSNKLLKGWKKHKLWTEMVELSKIYRWKKYNCKAEKNIPLQSPKFFITWIRDHIICHSNLLTPLPSNQCLCFFIQGSIKFNIEEYLYIGQGITHISRTELFKEGVQSGLAVTMTSTFSQCPRINDESLKSLQGRKKTVSWTDHHRTSF